MEENNNNPIVPSPASEPNVSAQSAVSSAGVPAGTPVTPIMASQPVNPVMPTPVNPVITPSGQGNPVAPGAPASAPAGAPASAPVAGQPASGAPVPPVFQPSGAGSVGGVGTLSVTEAIMRPEPAPAPGARGSFS